MQKAAKAIEMWAVERLSPYAKNARTHSDDQVAQIAASITEFGFTNPILVDSSDGIIAGHGRLMAAKKLGMERVPVIVLDYLTDEQRRAYIIADNKLALNAGWDTTLLSQELKDLRDLDFDLDLIGFSDDELAELLTDDEPATQGNTDEDEVPEVTEPICKPGDLWILGKHRLLCGDSTNVQHVEKLMGGEKADMVFTDPPYGVGYKYNSHDDDVSEEQHEQFSRDLVNLALGVSDRFIITPGCNNLELYCKISKPNHICCWTKTNAMSPGRITHFWTWEPIFFYGKFKRKRGNDVFNFPVGKQPDTGDHSCPKPIALWEDIIDNFSDRGESVLDFFLGSGTTIIACEKTNRRCLGLEIDPHYCDVIIERWQNFTGKQAVHEDGKLYDDYKRETA